MSAAEHHAPNHDYHLVNPSPWPALGALSGFVLAFGAIIYMHPDVVGAETLGAWTVIPGVLMVLFTMYVWWKDVVKEAHQ